jgi:hypothetical protein
LIRNFTSTSQNLEWSDVPWRKLSLDVESLHSLEWSDAEIHKISDVEGNVSALRVSITLLPGLGGLQSVTHKLNLFFSFS